MSKSVALTVLFASGYASETDRHSDLPGQELVLPGVISCPTLMWKESG